MLVQDTLYKYIGIKYKSQGLSFDGCDCWGLVYLFYKYEFNVELPENYVYLGNILKHLKKLDYPCKLEYGDILLFVLNTKMHVAIAIDDYKMLHNINKVNSCITKIDRYKNCLKKVYRLCE